MELVTLVVELGRRAKAGLKMMEWFHNLRSSLAGVH